MFLLRRRALFVALVAAAVGGCGPETHPGDAAAAAPPAGKAPEAAAAKSAPDAVDPRVTRADLARIKGDPAAKVWLVIMSDFQCPACKMWHDSFMAEVERLYVATGKVRMAYVNFPLQMHPNAVPAAEAAMCVGEQGKFWEFGEKAFAAQAAWSNLPDPHPAFAEMAAGLGADTARYAACVREHVMLPMIEADRQRGNVGGVNATPSFFIGNVRLEGAQPTASLRPILDKALAQAGVAK